MTYLFQTLRSEQILKIVLPALLTCFLFIFAMFWIALPTIENSLIEQKKKMINVLAQTTWNLMVYYEKELVAGNISLAKAQQSVKEQVRVLRYGSDAKGYFWINDVHPRMIMHPYLHHLEGQDLSEYSDKSGYYVFNQIVREVKENNEGFVPYQWQWNDVVSRISPKLSYVKLFRPWGWIIGTGVYLDDVKSEIRKVSQTMLVISVLVFLAVVLLLAGLIRQSIKEVRAKQIVEKELQQYQDNLEDLVEKRTAQLQAALKEVKKLSGFLPICSSCKKIRDDKGYWNQIESYIRDHSEAEFSHSICPGCVKKLYPEFTF
jgi:signal transduction histidine kinase